MITPRQLAAYLCGTQAPKIEEYIDSQLRTGRLRVDIPRSGWAQSDVDYVLDRYRAEGWYIQTVPGAWIFSSEPSR